LWRAAADTGRGRVLGGSGRVVDGRGRVAGDGVVMNQQRLGDAAGVLVAARGVTGDVKVTWSEMASGCGARLYGVVAGETHTTTVTSAQTRTDTQA